MIHRGRSFLAIIWFGSTTHPPPPLPQQVVSLSQFSLRPPYWRKRGEGGWGRSQSYDSKKAWSYMNHSILSESLSFWAENMLPLRRNFIFWKRGEHQHSLLLTRNMYQKTIPQIQIHLYSSVQYVRHVAGKKDESDRRPRADYVVNAGRRTPETHTKRQATKDDCLSSLLWAMGTSESKCCTVRKK